MDRRNFGWFVRGTLAALVFGLAVEAFRMGVDVSARPGVPTMGMLPQLYYSAGLFILGGMDLGTPLGGPALGRFLLWFAYFSAPIITTSTVVEGLRRVGYGAVERFGMHRHLVVAGLGRLGMGFVAANRQHNPRQMIVALDRDVNRAALTQARQHGRIHVLPGDIRLPNAFAHLALERASAVALLTNDDLLNLKVGFRLAMHYPRLRVVAHCSDLALERTLADAWGEAHRGRIHVFNSHRAAAQHLYHQHLREHFAGTQARDRVIIAGFGRFAQTILELLAQHPHEIDRISIAAPSASVGLRKFYVYVPAPEGLRVEPIDGELLDPETWDSIERGFADASAAPAVIVGSDDESVNYQSAILARRRWPDSVIYVRCQNESSFAEELAARHGFILLSVDALTVQALSEAQEAWFSRLEGTSAVASVRGAFAVAGRGATHPGLSDPKLSEGASTWRF